MPNRSFIIAAIALVALTGWGERRALQWPHAGPMPDDPVTIKPLRYEPVTQGNQSYRPVEPMPWGDVNKRVMPKGAATPPPAPAPAAAAATPAPTAAGAPPTPASAPSKATAPATAPIVPGQAIPPVKRMPPAAAPAPSGAPAP